jgi:succinate dehydrogenase / fumarate reductase membrane anchor subunit
MADLYTIVRVDDLLDDITRREWRVVMEDSAMSSRPAPQIGFSFEYLMWIFTRISGAVLIFLAIVGMALAFWMGARTQLDVGALMRWTFFPNSYHVVNTNIPDVVPQWANAYWQIMQMLIIFFGITHGVNGLRMVIEDYIGANRLRIFLRGLLFLFWMFMLIVAYFVILTV